MSAANEVSVQAVNHAGFRAAVVAVVLATVGMLPSRADAQIDGAQLYRRDCSRCHGPHGRGDGPDGGIFTSPPRDLRDDFLTKYSTAELVRRVRRGGPLALTVDRKALEHRERDVAALVAHLERLSTIDWKLAEAGLNTYADRCQSCHGVYGRPPASLPGGVLAPRDLSDPCFQRDTSDERLREVVRHGTPGMPALTPALPESDAAAVAAYVRVFSPGYELYVRFCSNCHGDDGRGAANVAVKGEPTVLDAAYFAQHDGAHLSNAVWHMMAEKKPQMPHLRREVSETAASAIVNFLKGLKR